MRKAKRKTKKKDNTGKALAVGAGIAMLSVAGYILFGPKGKKNRKKIHGWTVKMKGEIIEKCEQIKELNEPAYYKIVDQISKKYAKLKKVDAEDLEKVVKDLKKHWKMLVKDAKKTTKSVKKTKTKKTTKKSK